MKTWPSRTCNIIAYTGLYDLIVDMESGLFHYINFGLLTAGLSIETKADIVAE